MALVVHTARVDYGGPWRIDITRRGGSVFAPSWILLESGQKGWISWDEYRERYYDEMRKSYRAHRDKWLQLLARPCAVLVCFCPDPAECHRSLLADILGKLGARVAGELEQLEGQWGAPEVEAPEREQW